ncbi:MAG: hypothetical protein ACK50E_06835 [Bacteroidota bacterium]
MDIPAKITLSALERKLISDPEWILAKNEVIQKVSSLFGELSGQFNSNPLTLQLPEEVRSIPPKISKGEQYKGLPYLMLDYPRFFETEHVFAIRSFFWWGHFFSSTLHLKGRYSKMYAPEIVKMIKSKTSVEWMINYSEEEWIHDIEEKEHWVKANTIRQDEIEGKNLIKIAALLPVEKWEEAGDFLEKMHDFYLRALTKN